MADTNEEYTTVNNLTEITSIEGTEKVHVQDENDNDWSASIDDIADRALKRVSELTEPVYNTDDDLFPIIVEGVPAKEKLGTITAYASSKVLDKVKGTVECDDLGTTEDKTIILNVVPQRVSVTFIHKNTYGDTTLPVATYPHLVILNEDNETLATLDICDSRGHYAGTGCWNDNDTIDFEISMDTETTGKARIINSDIRQADTNYIIKADGSIILPDKPDYAHPKTITGNTWTTDERVFVCYTAFGEADYILKLNGLRISARTSSGGRYINDFNGIIEAGQELNSTYLSTDTVTRVYPLTF